MSVLFSKHIFFSPVTVELHFNRTSMESKPKEEKPMVGEIAYSIFNSRTIDDIHREIQEVYLESARPWVIGYSGGKDSTTALQLIWYALAELPPEQRKFPVYVISSDTLVETPVIVSYITGTLDRIEATASEEKMPFQTKIVRPKINDTFWVNLIGIPRALYPIQMVYRSDENSTRQSFYFGQSL